MAKKSARQISHAKQETWFSLIVTFAIGIVMTLLTFTPWNSGEESEDGKK